ncbi:MAG: aldehyde ferredoxin oxidoreductase N-terminal domain-containing protein [Anaerolineae bacterium]
MTELHGWTGNLLRVDLSTNDVSTMDTSQYVPKFVGGMGIAAKIAWDELEPGIGALDPENMLFVMVGPLTGTLASGGGRVLVAGIAPQQRPSVFSRSGMGGHWGAELKYAGFDGVIVTGKAEKPVYLWVHDGEAEIRDADHLWGTGTFATTKALRETHGPKTRVISCGQAGENLCRIACIQTETGNAAGQGGFGAVMGSKSLKAIAARGTLGVSVADPKRFTEVCMEASREGQSPQRGNASPGAREAARATAKRRMRKCGFCNTPCMMSLHMNVPQEDGEGTVNVVRQCWGYKAEDERAHLEGRAITSDYGLNGWEISYGIIPWLQMCKQHGLIEEIDGMEIPVPDGSIEYNRDRAPVSSEFLNMLLDKITFREGEIGDALADGACYAADHLFDGRGRPLLDHIYPRHAGQTNHWNGHWGTGGNIYFPFWLVPILQWCVDTRDPASDSTHQFTEHVLRYLPEHGPNRGPLSFEMARAVCAKVYGEPEVCNPDLAYDKPETKALPAIFHHNRGMLVESLVLCDREHTRIFSMESEDKAADTALMAKLFSACTGYETTEEELDAAGERVFNLLRAIDVQYFGRNREIDEQVARDLTHPAFTDGVELELKKFWPMLDRYYELRGWNPSNGCPTREKLAELGLEDVAAVLEAEGKLG